MSHFDYQASREIAGHGYPFYALIMAAYRQADTGNAILLEQAFPQATAEFYQRYHAPGGVLPHEREPGMYIDDDGGLRRSEPTGGVS